MLSSDDQKEIDEASNQKTVWIGGHRLEPEEESWYWVDGSPWTDYNNWYPWYESYQDYRHYYNDATDVKCLKIYREWWYPEDCAYRLSYVCKFHETDPQHLYIIPGENLPQSMSFFMDILGESLVGTKVPGFKVTFNLILQHF